MESKRILSLIKVNMKGRDIFNTYLPFTLVVAIFGLGFAQSFHSLIMHIYAYEQQGSVRNVTWCFLHRCIKLKVKEMKHRAKHTCFIWSSSIDSQWSLNKSDKRSKNFNQRDLIGQYRAATPPRDAELTQTHRIVKNHPHLLLRCLQDRMQSRRHGGLGGLSPPKQYSKPPWNMKHYKSVEFCQVLQYQASLHKCKAPPAEDILPTVLCKTHQLSKLRISVSVFCFAEVRHITCALVQPGGGPCKLILILVRSAPKRKNKK